ncbi:transcriptional regulator LysR family [Vibrio maritimus]|uniref:Transcriptional regulator LysR family n=1 Tax=Vibrio maritimus TaxID=990268 RepID=A0A090T3K6_9VIBR|nr:transcriptional regulator LysR family [Vibrio maritimus]
MTQYSDKIDLNLFRTFAAVYKHDSISRAAEELNVTPASVSQSIKKLSNELNTSLFMRRGRGITPTLQAHHLIARIKPLLHEFDVITNDCLFDTSQSSRRKIVVQAPEPIIFEHIKRTELANQDQSRFRLEWLDILYSNSDSYETLKFKYADAIIDIFQLAEPNICNDLLFEDEVVVIAAKDHPRVGSSISAEQFAEESHIILNYQFGESSLFEMLYNSQPPKRRILSTQTSLTSMLSLTSESEALCLCTKRFAQQQASRLPIKILPFPGHVEPVKFWLIYPVQNRDTQAIKWLRSTLLGWIRQQIESQPT